MAPLQTSYSIKFENKKKNLELVPGEVIALQHKDFLFTNLFHRCCCCVPKPREGKALILLAKLKVVGKVEGRGGDDPHFARTWIIHFHHYLAGVPTFLGALLSFTL